MTAKCPQTGFCTAASRLALAIPQLAYGHRMLVLTSRLELGVSKRNEYGSSVCVPPVARRAGVVFGGCRRISHSSFSKVSPRRRAACPCASCRPSCQTALRSSSLPPYRARVALEARRSANTGARLQAGRCSGRHGRLGRVRLVECRRRSSPLYRRQSHPPRKPVVRTLHEHGFATFG